MEEVYKIVEFDKYCKTCKFNKTSTDDEPCSECMCYLANAYSHKPVNYEEVRKNNKKEK